MVVTVYGRDSVIRLSYGYKVPTNREQQIQEDKNMYYSNGNYEAFFTKDEDLYDKKIEDAFTDEFFSSNFTGEPCLPLRNGTAPWR